GEAAGACRCREHVIGSLARLVSSLLLLVEYVNGDRVSTCFRKSSRDPACLEDVEGNSIVVVRSDIDAGGLVSRDRGGWEDDVESDYEHDSAQRDESSEYFQRLAPAMTD